jgi:stalled ribosome rescue protein Dom34
MACYTSVKVLAPKQGYRRGYPVAVLVGVEENQAALWKVFSNVVKPERTVNLNGARNDSKALYNFHEAVVNALRPTMKEGVKSIIIAAPPRTTYTEKLLDHIKSHHTWLMQGQSKAIFSQLTGSATTIPQVTVLTRNSTFSKIVSETNTEETENLIDLLEKRLNATGPEPLVLYSLEEIENQILSEWKTGKPKPEYLLQTDSYLSTSRQRGRLQRLMQVATNRQVKTRIVKADSPSGKRLAQLGGFVCLQQIE